jgi:MFS-type transporter involved in bile tolerance (Atg22 family)
MAAAGARATCTDEPAHAAARHLTRLCCGLDGAGWRRAAWPFSRQSVLNPGVRKREVFGWAMYDFANSGYTTVVITAVFAAYFVGGIAGGADWATLAWTVALSVSYAIVMLTMPSLGAYADLHAAKKALLIWSTAGCVVATAALALAGPAAWRWPWCSSSSPTPSTRYGESLTAAFLPELARPKAWARSAAGAGVLVILAACWRWAAAWAM